MVNRSVFVWILRLVFMGVLAAHAGYLIETGRGPQGNFNVYSLLLFLWAPIASGVTAATGFYFIFEKWLWRLSWTRGWLVLFPDLTGTWLAKSYSETFANVPHYALVTIRHDFDRLSYRAWRKESTVLSEACILERVGQELRLFVVYGNKVGGFRAEHGIDHDGCLRVALLNEAMKKSWTLEGEYWTNKKRQEEGVRDRGTVGTISMKWCCRKLVGEHSDEAKSHFREESRAIDKYKAAQIRIPVGRVAE
jgi:hypothetical protein